ncbi:mitochondrial inner membrane protein OXA1L [Dichotomopilus funicola]|uniref:Mitochondrial inner membrane protein OXA1L n=1 Tax=Dichotomopilus funicola TaxID=1934379 RepID=A0AAN6V808_9PEZI|nr:mitochondrial inner membrane protein OXA1L [Dichotomopilus funicola]
MATPAIRTLPLPNPNHHGHQQIRPFSLYPLIETTLSLSHTALTTLHTATGTPWFLTIPLFSLAVSLFTRLPAIIYSRHTHQRLQRIQPLANAWRARVTHDLQGDGGRGRGQQLTPKSFYNHARAAQSKLYRRWGVHTWRETGMRVAAVPFWLVGIESIRRICGGPRGVVGTFLFGRGEGVMTTTAGGWVDGSVTAASTSAADIQQAVVAASSSSSSGYAADPTLMTGGCLWFPDLTAADPLHILPLALSVVFVLNIMPNTMSGIRLLFGARDPQNPGTSDAAVLDPAMKWRLRLQRSLLMVGIAVGPLTMDLPCALHLYWITSSLSGNLQAQVISKLMPLPKTVPPAKMQEPIFISPTRESVAFEEERARQWAQEKRNRQ